jgi:hypothetical protein
MTREMIYYMPDPCFIFETYLFWKFLEILDN